MMTIAGQNNGNSKEQTEMFNGMNTHILRDGISKVNTSLAPDGLSKLKSSHSTKKIVGIKNSDDLNECDNTTKNNNAVEFPIVHTGRINVIFPYNTTMVMEQMPADLNFENLKRLIAIECNDDYKNLKLTTHGMLITNTHTPKDVFRDISVPNDIKCVFRNPAKTTKIKLGTRTLLLTDNVKVPVYVYKGVIEDSGSQPDLLSVFLNNKQGTRINKVIEINWLSRDKHKPFLGGYKSKIDDRIFYNANAQTLYRPIRYLPVSYYSRETQTYQMKHASQDTLEVSSTGMTKVGFYYSNATDKLIEPLPYETYDEYAARVLQCVILIQRWVRRWLTMRYVARLRRQRDIYYKWLAAQESKQNEERASRFSRDYERRLHPKRRADFDRLFNALEQWRREETAKIYANSRTLAERKAALALLLDRETELINDISRHQICVSKLGRVRADERLLEKAAACKRWTASHDGKPVERDTPETLRARELLVVYEGLKSNCLANDERLDLLLTVKKLAQTFSSKICCELIILVERETELMLRKVPVEKLVGLRLRILHLFIQFCKIPEYNPGISNFLPVPNPQVPGSQKAMWAGTHSCKSCGRYLRTKEFPSAARASSLGVCFSCRRQGNRGRDRIDLEPYRIILVNLRKKEAELLLNAIEDEKRRLAQLELRNLDRDEAFNVSEIEKRKGKDGFDSESITSPLTETEIKPTTDKYELLVNVDDIYFLVNEVWDNRSALSGYSELADLTLCRWQILQPWAPWNTFLVTKKEADLHCQLKSIDLESLYADAMLRRVKQRLVIAKNAFLRLCPTGEILGTERKVERKVARTPEDTNEWRMVQRHSVACSAPPLYIMSVDDRHKPNLQPPKAILPIIRGEKKMEQYGLHSFRELSSWGNWPLWKG